MLKKSQNNKIQHLHSSLQLGIFEIKQLQCNVMNQSMSCHEFDLYEWNVIDTSTYIWFLSRYHVFWIFVYIAHNQEWFF